MVQKVNEGIRYLHKALELDTQKVYRILDNT